MCWVQCIKYVWNQTHLFNWAAGGLKVRRISEHTEDSVPSQYGENEINKGETGVMRLVCDSEGTGRRLSLAERQRNRTAEPQCVQLDLPLSLSLSLINCHTRMSNRITDCGADCSARPAQTWRCCPKVKQSTQPQTAAHFTTHNSICHLWFLLFVI